MCNEISQVFAIAIVNTSTRNPAVFHTQTITSTQAMHTVEKKHDRSSVKQCKTECNEDAWFDDFLQFCRYFWNQICLANGIRYFDAMVDMYAYITIFTYECACVCVVNFTMHLAMRKLGSALKSIFNPNEMSDHELIFVFRRIVVSISETVCVLSLCRVRSTIVK